MQKICGLGHPRAHNHGNRNPFLHIYVANSVLNKKESLNQDIYLKQRAKVKHTRGTIIIDDKNNNNKISPGLKELTLLQLYKLVCYYKVKTTYLKLTLSSSRPQLGSNHPNGTFSLNCRIFLKFTSELSLNQADAPLYKYYQRGLIKLCQYFSFDKSMFLFLFKNYN